MKVAKKNPQSDKFAWMYEDKTNSSQQTSGTPSPAIEYKREATQAYNR